MITRNPVGLKTPPIKSEHIVGLIVVVGLALAVAVTVQNLFMPVTGAGPSESERKKAFEEALEKGNLSLEDARYWRVTNDENPGKQVNGNDETD